MYIYIISRDWKNIMMNNLPLFKFKLKRDGFDLKSDRFFIISANLRHFGQKKINQQITVFYLICPQFLMPCFMIIASFIFFFKCLFSEKPNLCYITTPLFAPSFVFCKYFFSIPIFSNFAGSVSEIVGGKGIFKKLILAKIILFLELLGAKISDIIMPISDWLRECLIKWKIPSQKIIFRPRPIWMFNPKINSKKIEKLREKYNLKGKKVIFTAARLEREKNIGIVFRALKKLNFKNVIYLIAGSGSQEEKLKKIVKDYNLENKVLFLGYISREEIWNYYYLSDLFILPSLSEGLGAVIIEAMLMGKPVIGSDIPGVRQLVKERETGLLFNPLDENDLTKKIKFFLAKPEIIDEITKKAKEKVEDYLKNYKTIRQIYKIYLQNKKV